MTVVSLPVFGICQNQVTDCNEKPGAPHKLFVFIGELLQGKEIVSAKPNVNEPRYSATYRIIERVCGNYLGDTISFHVIDWVYDSTFKKNRYQLLMLIRDTTPGDDYVLWGGLYFNVAQGADKQWAGSYMSKNDVAFENQKARKPKRIRFSEKAFYDTRGVTREEIDITYPEPFFKIRKGKVIPLLGYTIDGIFRHEKDGTLAHATMRSFSGEMPFHVLLIRRKPH